MSKGRYWNGKLGYATNWQGEACLSIDLNSGYEEHEPHLSIIVGRVYILLNMPKWVVQPHRRKVMAETWDAATVARMGRDWYWHETRREFGLSLSLSDVRVKYGVQPDAWPGDKSLMWSFPWMKLRYMGQRWYDLDGNLCETMSNAEERACLGKTGRYFTELREEVEARVPKAVFEVEDFDGTRIRATTHIEEREWHRGEGWFKWLAWVFPARVRRSMAVEFDKEVGYEKGSWKGGLMGTGIDLEPGELHESAMRRFCAAGVRNKSGISALKFVGPAR
jgi:hypothetical protein